MTKTPNAPHDNEPLMKALEHMAQGAKITYKSTSGGVMVIRKTDPKKYTLYPDTDDYGGFKPPSQFQMLMTEIDDMIEGDALDEDDIAAYNAIVKLLSCPLAALQQTALEMLIEIFDNNQRDDGEEHMTDKKEETKTAEVPTLEPEEDISDEEMLSQLDDKPEILHED